MPLTELDLLLRTSSGVGFELIPHVEELALKYVFRNYVMPSRVALYTDMSGWNVRKISQYLPSRRAQELDEDTAIPDTKLVRTRKAEIEPKEVGERYRVSNRRADTDLESILTDVVEAIGKSIGDKLEYDLIEAANGTFRGGDVGSDAEDYDLSTMLKGATLFRQRVQRDQIFHVIHPYQALPVMEKLIDYTGAQTNMSFRDGAVNNLARQSLTEFDLPTFGNVNLTIADYLPRRVVYKCTVDATGGTFRLQLGNGYDTSGTAQSITGEITYSGTIGTLTSNIASAINALPVAVRKGTWVVTGSDKLDITITPPAGFYWNDEDNLRVAVKYDEDDNLDGGFIEANLQKSAYDLLTGASGDITDMNGNTLGVALYERSATARSLMWQRSALILDIREAVQSFFEVVFQGRTAEYSGYMTYGVGQWSPEKGMFISSKATSPLSV